MFNGRWKHLFQISSEVGNIQFTWLMSCFRSVDGNKRSLAFSSANLFPEFSWNLLDVWRSRSCITAQGESEDSQICYTFRRKSQQRRHSDRCDDDSSVTSTMFSHASFQSSTLTATLARTRSSRGKGVSQLPNWNSFPLHLHTWAG